ncbi:hypothetical protein [Pseudobacteriovorax antillogorgiicola]|uniref:Uncharacterized protein n=1 Tax=Pseudobacteriovorax antillogorgiicola TaxID=1513793 RepID=A0A1Y6B823_9BACT|nr:hypothetical protein [Pseudobacteriovorax antillogorgiicola]TCS58536.1 hypothetical protein EDD56_10249 [Pseudobacteriovorax antillogorgiicola]SME97848.1 hypothetical protein SAMN06296036_102394 [Pseudobacteriovorax antillogorgiicola]
MADHIRDTYHKTNFLELGYLAFRQGFFRHGRLVKVFHEAGQLVDASELSDFRPHIVRIPDFPLNVEDNLDIVRCIERLKSKSPKIMTLGLNASDVVKYAMAENRNVKELLESYKQAGLDYLGGNDFINCVSKSANAASMWFEVHELAHSIGLRSEVCLYPTPDLDYDTLCAIFHRIDQLQDQYRGFSYISFPDRGRLRMQLRLISLARLLIQNIHDFKIVLNSKNTISSQAKLGFGINLVACELSENNQLNRQNFDTIIKKSHRIPVDFVEHALNEQEAQSFNSMKLYRLKNSSNHDLDHLNEVITHSPLPAMGVSVDQASHDIEFTDFHALSIDTILSGKESIAIPTNRNIAICFGCMDDQNSVSPFGLESLKAFLKGREGQVQLVGFRGIWAFCQALKIKLEDFAPMMRDAGISVVSSSELETEASLTTSEIINLHRIFHSNNIRTVAKLELAAPYNGTDTAFWQPFLQRLLAFTSLHEDTGMVDGIIVQESSNSFISIQEYLKAVSITRIVARNIQNIITPINRLFRGVMQPKITTDREFKNVVDLLQAFGGTKLGIKNEPAGSGSPAEVYESISSS